MLKFARLALITAAVVSAGVTAASPALAGGRHWDQRGEPVGRVNDDAVALGLFGLAAGVIAGSVIASQPRGPRYVEPDYVEPRRYVEPEYEPDYRSGPRPIYSYDNDYPPPPSRATYGAGAEAWSPEWYRYCQARYRSFDPRTGTFIGFDNRRHFCTAG